MGHGITKVKSKSQREIQGQCELLFSGDLTLIALDIRASRTRWLKDDEQ